MDWELEEEEEVSEGSLLVISVVTEDDASEEGSCSPLELTAIGIVQEASANEHKSSWVLCRIRFISVHPFSYDWHSRNGFVRLAYVLIFLVSFA